MKCRYKPERKEKIMIEWERDKFMEMIWNVDKR